METIVAAVVNTAVAIVGAVNIGRVIQALVDNVEAMVSVARMEHDVDAVVAGGFVSAASDVESDAGDNSWRRRIRPLARGWLSKNTGLEHKNAGLAAKHAGLECYFGKIQPRVFLLIGVR